jgi:uncharacterized membrane protein
MGAVDETPEGMKGPEVAEPAWASRLHDRLEQYEQLLRPGLRAVGRVQQGAQDALLPAWRQVTEGETRWQVSMAILAAITMELLLPQRLAALPRWVLPALAFLLLVGLVAANPRRIDKESEALRLISMLLIAVLSVANAIAAAHLVGGLIHGTEGRTAAPLLATGGDIWLTNVIVFALWYWELDRGGPVARAHAERDYPDFLFPQMQSPELAPSDWEPKFLDYLYLSFTNASAFSPTDVLPLTRWTKMTMLVQSVVSLATVALVIARAVNILR